MKKQTIYTENTVDKDTGEIVPKRWITRQVKNDEQFIKTYLDDIGIIVKCSNTEKNIIFCCLSYLDYSTNEVVLNPLRRKEICTKIDSTIGTVNVCFMRLFQKNIFIKENGKIILNPKLFFYGDELTRSKLMELTIKYEILDRVDNKAIKQNDKFNKE